MSILQTYLHSDSGAVTVDWVVLTAAAAGMALAATALVSQGLESLASDLEAQLRTQQVSDAFVQFNSSHFDALYNAGTLTEADAQSFFTAANDLTNAQILTALEDGILAYHDGTLAADQVAMLIAVASVAVQRNIITAADVNILPYTG